MKKQITVDKLGESCVCSKKGICQYHWDFIKHDSDVIDFLLMKISKKIKHD